MYLLVPVQKDTLMYMKNINLTITEELLEMVDQVRGDVPRNAFIRTAIYAHLGRAAPAEPQAREPVVVARPPKPKSGGSTPSTGAFSEPVRSFEECNALDARHPTHIETSDVKRCLKCGATKDPGTWGWTPPPS